MRGRSAGSNISHCFPQEGYKERGFGTAQNHDVFDRDPSFYSSLDKDKMGS